MSGVPWSVATKASPKAQKPKTLDPQPQANFQKTATAGSKDKDRGKDSTGKGKAFDRIMEAGGKTCGGKSAGRVKQTCKLGDWHVRLVGEEHNQWNAEGRGSSSSGIGRGKALIQPSWKTSTGLAWKNQQPSLTEE